MNETIDLLKNHSSIRDFENKAIPGEQVNEIFKAAN